MIIMESLEDLLLKVVTWNSGMEKALLVTGKDPNAVCLTKVGRNAIFSGGSQEMQWHQWSTLPRHPMLGQCTGILMGNRRGRYKLAITSLKSCPRVLLSQRQTGRLLSQAANLRKSSSVNFHLFANRHLPLLI